VHRRQLQHVLLEIGRRFGLHEVYIIGSAAILAAFPDPPAGALTATRDVDVIPPDDDERIADRISFVLGEASDFELEHGYYAQGVTSLTPTFAPQGWRARAIPITVEGITGWCMAPHDLVLSELGAGREKDLDFARSAAAAGLVLQEVLMRYLDDVNCTEEHRRWIAARIDALFG